MAYTLTTEQADEVVRLLGFDGQVEDHSFIESVAGPFHHYFLEDGTIIEIGTDGQIQHQQLIEDAEEGLKAVDMKDVTSVGVAYGVNEYFRDGKSVGYAHLMDIMDDVRSISETW